MRGFRIELGEIEAALGAHPGVRDAVRGGARGRAGDKRLVAYVAPRGEAADAAERCARPSARLPGVHGARGLRGAGRLPLTPNGKVDRKALPAPERAAAGAARATSRRARRPRRRWRRIWAQVLGLERVGIDDNFFDLGGHSLLATQVVSRLRERSRSSCRCASCSRPPRWQRSPCRSCNRAGQADGHGGAGQRLLDRAGETSRAAEVAAGCSAASETPKSRERSR